MQNFNRSYATLSEYLPFPPGYISQLPPYTPISISVKSRADDTVSNCTPKTKTINFMYL